MTSAARLALPGEPSRAGCRCRARRVPAPSFPPRQAAAAARRGPRCGVGARRRPGRRLFGVGCAAVCRQVRAPADFRGWEIVGGRGSCSVRKSRGGRNDPQLINDVGGVHAFTRPAPRSRLRWRDPSWRHAPAAGHAPAWRWPLAGSLEGDRNSDGVVVLHSSPAGARLVSRASRSES